MNYLKIMSGLSTVVAISLIGTGCSVKNSAEPKHIKLNPVMEPHHNSEMKNGKELQSLRDIIYNKKRVTQAEQNVVSKSTIIGDYDEDEYETLPTELRHKKVNNFNVNGMKLGSAIKLILSQTENIGFIPEPNVDLNKAVTMSIKDMSIYEALKNLVFYSGYSVSYNTDKKSIIISPFIKREYRIPSAIFNERGVDINLGSDSDVSSAAKPIFNMNNENVYDEFIKDLKKQGSSEKQFVMDKQAGILYIKEKPFYIKDIDNFVVDFVQNRMSQYSVELAIIEYHKNDANRFNIDLGDIITNSGMYLSSLTGSAITSSSIESAISSGGVVLSGGYGAYNGPAASASTYANISGNAPQLTGNPLSFKYMLDVMNSTGYVNVVQKPNTVIQNHTVGYISSAQEQSYVASWKKNTTTTVSGSESVFEPVIKKYRDGITLPVRVDSYKNGTIQVSVAVNIANTNLKEYNTKGQPPVFTEERNIRETYSVVNIKDGDVIILGGLKGQTSRNDKQEPLASYIPFLGEVFKNENGSSSETETAFIIKVKKINRVKDTHGNQTYKLKNMYRKSM